MFGCATSRETYRIHWQKADETGERRESFPRIISVDTAKGAGGRDVELQTCGDFWRFAVNIRRELLSNSWLSRHLSLIEATESAEELVLPWRERAFYARELRVVTTNLIRETSEYRASLEAKNLGKNLAIPNTAVEFTTKKAALVGIDGGCGSASRIVMAAHVRRAIVASALVIYVTQSEPVFKQGTLGPRTRELRDAKRKAERGEAEYDKAAVAGIVALARSIREMELGSEPTTDAACALLQPKVLAIAEAMSDVVVLQDIDRGAFEFIVGHELGHLVMSHSCALQTAEGTVQYCRLRQDAELEADRFGTALVALSGGAWRDAVGGFGNIGGEQFFSLVFDRAGMSKDERCTHPPPAVRLSHVKAQALDFIRKECESLDPLLRTATPRCAER
jgi:hypothetical protein